MLGASVSGPARQLDPAALGDHVDRLYRAAWALCGSREDAEDLVQETFAKVLVKPRFLRNDDDLGYLLRVLRNTFVSRHRAAMRRPQSDADARGARAGRPVRRHPPGRRGRGARGLRATSPRCPRASATR